MNALEEKNIHAYLKHTLSSTNRKTREAARKVYWTFDNRLLAVENASTQYEKEEQRKGIISYFISMALCIKPYTNEAFESAKNIFENSLRDKSKYHECCKELACKNYDDLKRVSASTKNVPHEGHRLTDDKILGPVRDLLKHGDMEPSLLATMFGTR